MFRNGERYRKSLTIGRNEVNLKSIYKAMSKIDFSILLSNKPSENLTFRLVNVNANNFFYQEFHKLKVSEETD